MSAIDIFVRIPNKVPEDAMPVKMIMTS